MLHTEEVTCPKRVSFACGAEDPGCAGLIAGHPLSGKREHSEMGATLDVSAVTALTSEDGCSFEILDHPEAAGMTGTQFTAGGGVARRAGVGEAFRVCRGRGGQTGSKHQQGREHLRPPLVRDAFRVRIRGEGTGFLLQMPG